MGGAATGGNATPCAEFNIYADPHAAKEVFDSGTLGEIHMIRSTLYGFNGNMHDWHTIPEEGGGMLYDWGVHLLDQFCFMFPGAKIKSVFGNLPSWFSEKITSIKKTTSSKYELIIDNKKHIIFDDVLLNLNILILE